MNPSSSHLFFQQNTDAWDFSLKPHMKDCRLPRHQRPPKIKHWALGLQVRNCCDCANRVTLQSNALHRISWNHPKSLIGDCLPLFCREYTNKETPTVLYIAIWQKSITTRTNISTWYIYNAHTIHHIRGDKM